MPVYLCVFIVTARGQFVLTIVQDLIWIAMMDAHGPLRIFDDYAAIKIIKDSLVSAICCDKRPARNSKAASHTQLLWEGERLFDLAKVC